MFGLGAVFLFDTAVVGRNDADLKPQFFHSFGQGTHYIGQAAGFRQGGAFGSGDQDLRQSAAAQFFHKVKVFPIHTGETSFVSLVS